MNTSKVPLSPFAFRNDTFAPVRGSTSCVTSEPCSEFVARASDHAGVPLENVNSQIVQLELRYSLPKWYVDAFGTRSYNLQLRTSGCASPKWSANVLISVHPAVDSVNRSAPGWCRSGSLVRCGNVLAGTLPRRVAGGIKHRADHS